MDLQALIGRAYTLLASGREAELLQAGELALQAVAIDKLNVNARLILAQVACCRYQYPLALAYLLDACSIGFFPPVKRELLNLYLATGQYGDAVRIAIELHQAQTEPLEQLENLASGLLASGQTKSAAILFEQLGKPLPEIICRGSDQLSTEPSRYSGVIEWQGDIEAPEDFELGLPRFGRLSYACTGPVERCAAGLVFVIPGFGADGQPGYQANLRAYLAKTYGLLAVTVRYHCSENRPVLGARGVISPRQVEMIRRTCEKKGVSIPTSNLTLEHLQKLAEKMPNTLFPALLLPPNGDYQNFGVLQTLDHLRVLAHLLQQSPLNFDHNNIIAFGSSHGGYLAHLLARFAPNTIATVIDNSGYTGLGNRNIKFITGDYGHAMDVDVAGGITPEFSIGLSSESESSICYYTVSPWAIGPGAGIAPYDSARQSIRSLAQHVEVVRKNAGRLTRYRMIHSVADRLETIQDKRAYLANLRSLGCDAELREIDSADVDGTFARTTDHGLGLSLKKLFDSEYSQISAPMQTNTDFELGTHMVFSCENLRYEIKYSQDSVSMSCTAS